MMSNSYSIGFWGDFTSGENYQAKYDVTEHINVLRQKGYDYLLEKVSPILKSFDFNIVNLETTLALKNTSTLAHKKTVLHWSDADKLIDLLQKNNIKAVSLGNNHIMDYDKKGLEDTITSLSCANICTFGAGLNLRNASLPLLRQIVVGDKKLNLYVFGGYKYRKDYDEDFKFYASQNKEGVFLLTPDTLNESIRAIKDSDKESVVVVFPHFGFDLMKKTQLQIDYAHSFIDAGADYVFGHGPHMMNSVEIYNGKLIIYGLGNFVFPANFGGKVFPYNMGAELRFENISGNIIPKVNIYPIYMDNQSYSPQTRPILDSELDEFLDLLFEDAQELREKSIINNSDNIISVGIL